MIEKQKQLIKQLETTFQKLSVENILIFGEGNNLIAIDRDEIINSEYGNRDKEVVINTSNVYVYSKTIKLS